MPAACTYRRPAGGTSEPTPGDKPITVDSLPDLPPYCFAPAEDTEVAVQQIRTFVEGMDASIDTSLNPLTEEDALAVADKLNRPLGWTRAACTAFRSASVQLT